MIVSFKAGKSASALDMSATQFRLRQRENFRALSLVILALSSFACGSAQASENPKPNRDQACLDEAYENIHPECTEAERLRLHSRFDLPPIESYSRQRRSQGEAIAALYWTKIGGGTALILYRDRKGIARLELRLVPFGSRHRRVIVRRTKIAEELWLELLAKAHSLNYNYRSYDFCVGGTNIMLEAMSTSGRLRTRRHDLCYRDDDVLLYFHDLAGTALAAFPFCALPGRHLDNKSDADAILHRCLAPSRYSD